jgi:hypothetical protein
MSSKRPSLAESMRQAVQPEPAPPPVAPAAARPTAPPPEPPATKPAGFYAATRAGKKKVTATVSPEMRRELKNLAATKDTTIEALLLEAIADLLMKHGANRAA